MGGGLCPYNFCGQLQTVAATPSSGYAQSGADSLCNSGRVCVVGKPVSTGDAFQLDCVAPAAGALAYGAACSTNPADNKRCADDSLCVTGPDSPSQLFCSRMCRNDADCPTGSSCLEHTTANAPNGSPARVGMCTPTAKISATTCKRESDCPAGQGCMPTGGRTALYTCQPAPGSKTVGQACGAAAECRSNACYDRQFTLPGGGNRAYCTSTCTVNSDCGPDQTCVRLIENNNGTSSDPTDDVVVGICQTLFIQYAAAGCDPASCTVSVTGGVPACDTTHGLCYNSAAVPGTACNADTDCQLGGTCSQGSRFTHGYCQTFGCSPTAAAGSADSCAGVGSVCAQRGGPDAPLSACYDGCQLGSDAGGATCLRSVEGYFCDAPVPGAAAQNLPGPDRDLSVRHAKGVKAAVLGVAMTVLSAGVARAQVPPAPVAAPADSTPAPPAVPVETTAAPAATAAIAQPAPMRAVGPIPTADASPAGSDHDLVIGHWGITARKLDTGPVPLALRPQLGCVAGAGVSCTVNVGALGARYWTSRNLAWNGALALASGGGSSGSASLDTYLGVGPIVGVSVLLGNWRHLSVLASPELAFLWFRPAGGSTSSTVMFDVQAAIEAELHFGFIGVPALSIGLLAGAAVQYEAAPGTHVWTLGVIGGGSAWNALTSLSLRYYL